VPGRFDVAVFHLLNGWDGRNPGVDRAMHILCDDLFLRGAPLLLLFWLAWFAPSAARGGSRVRARMLCGLAATCVLTLVSVSLQAHLHVHVRPLLDPALHPRIDADTSVREWLELGHLNSFPSDTSVMYCGLAAVIALVNVRVGWAALAWAFLVIGVPRVYFGYHFASDVLAGSLLGAAGTAWLGSRPWLCAPAERVLAWFQPREAWLNALLFLAMFDMANLFKGSRYLLQGVHALLRLI
jgi:undecaprenyl-diphosphatase